jgi:hypothetical protein
MRPLEGTPTVARPLLMDREKDYVLAFKFYMKLGLPIVFVENSDYHSEQINRLGEQIPGFEYFTFMTRVSIQGKGHGEAEIIHYAMQNSELLKQSEWIVKITGRYKIHNLTELIANLNPPEAQVLVNWGRNLSMSDTRVMFLKEDFIRNYLLPFMNQHLLERDGLYFETVFARSVHQYLADGHRSGLWPAYPEYFGINGSNGRVVKFSMWRKLKFKYYYSIKRWIYYQMV